MSTSKDNFFIKETMETASKIVSNCSAQEASENVNEAKSSVEAEPSMTSNTNDESSPSEKSTENLIFNRANVESLGNYVHLVDSDDDNKLDMFCYVKCNESDNDLLKQCRGVVFNGNNIVMKAFPYTSEFVNSDLEMSSALKEFNNFTFYESHEGTLIRMFNFNGKWYLSTHRKLNAFRSKWSSRESFGTSFKNALTSEEEINNIFKNSLPEGDNILERFQSTLDTDKQYMFLIRNNTENRIVCYAPELPKVYHVGTFVDGNLVFTENVNLPIPKKLNFLNIDELREYVDSVNYKEIQGIIAFGYDRQIKVLNKDYQELFWARGNEPSIKFRYLQVRMNRRIVNMLYHLYPNMICTFENYENTLYDIARSIYRAYVQRFIKKQYVTVHRDEFAIIRECHSWHLENRSENRISLDQVIRVMNRQSPTHLNHMIRRFNLEQSLQNDQNNTRNRTESFHSVKSFEQSPSVRSINPSFFSNKSSPVRKNGDRRMKEKVATIHQRNSLNVPTEH